MIPLAWTTGSLGLIFAFFMWGPDSMSIVVLRVWDVMAQCAKIVAQEITPITDLRASADYRKDLAETLSRRTLMACMADVTP